MEDDEIAINVVNETIRLFGISYTLDFFRMLAFGDIGTVFRLVTREDGTLTLEIPPPEASDAG